MAVQNTHVHTLYILSLPLFPVRANWMAFPPTPQKASMISWEWEKLCCTLRAMCSAILSGVTENQPSETQSEVRDACVCILEGVFCISCIVKLNEWKLAKLYQTHRKSFDFVRASNNASKSQLLTQLTAHVLKVYTTLFSESLGVDEQLQAPPDQRNNMHRVTVFLVTVICVSSSCFFLFLPT